MAEGRLAHSDTQAREADGEVAGLRAQLASTSEALQRAAAENDALRAEARALGEDLEALVKENQVGGDLGGALGVGLLGGMCGGATRSEGLFRCRWGAHTVQQTLFLFERLCDVAPFTPVLCFSCAPAPTRAVHCALCLLVVQVVSGELSAAASQRDGALTELQRTGQRLSQSEQLLRAKGLEVEDLRQAYEALALDARR